MERHSLDEAVLVRYLLGDLSTSEQEQVEKRAFSDREYLDTLDAVEADLIDSYIRGELSAVERRQFESRFFASSERRAKIEFARALAEVAAESHRTTAATSVAAPARRPSWRNSVQNAFGRRSVAVQYAVAAASVLLVAALSWQIIETTRLHRRIVALEAERQDQQNREEALKRASAEEHGLVENLKAQLSRDASRSSGSAAPIVSLVLLPGVTRGPTTTERLLVPQSAQLVRIEIRLEATDQYPQFRAELRTRNGRDIFTQGSLRPRPSATGLAVVLDIPASTLTTGDYEIKLQGVLNGNLIDIGYYDFSAVKQ